MAHWRPQANPDENNYYAAAAGIDSTGRLYLAANNEHIIKDPFEGRGCAETAMLDKFHRKTGEEDVVFKALYLMSGKIDSLKSVKPKIFNEPTGAVSCLCGECRRNMREHMDVRSNSGSGTFFMVPTNDGSAELTINADAKSASEFKVNGKEAWQLSVEQMYPLPKEMPCNDEQKSAAVKGYDVLKNEDKMPPLKTDFDNIFENGVVGGVLQITQGVVATVSSFIDAFRFPTMSMVGLNAKPMPENINRGLLHLIKDAYDAHKDTIPGGKNLKITAVIIKSTENPAKFYPATMVEGEGWLPSKPQVFATALSNMGNRKGIAEVYVMNFDKNKLDDASRAGSNGSPYTEAIPDPAMIGRLLKNMNSRDKPNIHIIPVNDGTSNESALQEIMLKPINAREAFGPGYLNPKEEIAAARF